MEISEIMATYAIGLAILELFRYLGFIGFEYTLPVFVDKSFMIAGAFVDMQRIFIVIIGTALVIGLLFNPVRDRVQAVVDRVFFPQRLDYNDALGQWSEVLGTAYETAGKATSSLAIVVSSVARSMSGSLRTPRRLHRQDLGAQRLRADPVVGASPFTPVSPSFPPRIGGFRSRGRTRG